MRPITNATSAAHGFTPEIDQHGTFMRLGSVEVYARRDRTGRPSWGIFREPGAVDIEVGRFRLTVPRTPEKEG